MTRMSGVIGYDHVVKTIIHKDPVCFPYGSPLFFFTDDIFDSTAIIAQSPQIATAFVAETLKGDVFIYLNDQPVIENVVLDSVISSLGAIDDD